MSSFSGHAPLNWGRQAVAWIGRALCIICIHRPLMQPPAMRKSSNENLFINDLHDENRHGLRGTRRRTC